MNDDLLTWFYTSLNEYSARLKKEENTSSELALRLYTTLRERHAMS